MLLNLYLIACTGLTLAAACATLDRIGSAVWAHAALAPLLHKSPLTCRHRPNSSRAGATQQQVRPAAAADIPHQYGLPSRGGLFDQALARAHQQRMADWLAERGAA